ncbi:MAG TPA: carboxypeptidase-like regulatory domain-containing protein, partial [Mucilaginibacter sp.]
MDKNLLKRLKYQISLMITGLFLYCSAHAQTVSVTGKVTSADDDQPIPGVSIKIKGTGLGTVSNIDGSYSISAEPG